MTDDSKIYLHNFLKVRGLAKPDGRMLFRYKTTSTEYQEIQQRFGNSIKALCWDPLTFNSREECALFVLYAAEWWRREYDGGAWKWASIFESFSQGNYKIDPQERAAAIERGLYAWQLRTSPDGKKYFGSIVANGGLPLKMVAQGDGTISKLLLGATRKAQLLGWDEHSLKAHFQSRERDLISHLRANQIYDLLAKMIFAVLELRNEYKLAGVSNPVEVLEQRCPDWRERFPISVDVKDTSIEPLLRGLVKEAAYQATIKTLYPVIITRTLNKVSSTDDYQLEMSLDVQKNIPLEALASAMEMGVDKIPHSFSLEILGDLRISLAQGRQVLSTQSSTIFLSARPRRVMNRSAAGEVILTMRVLGTDISSSSSIPNGQNLELDQPWCFVDKNGIWIFLATGSCRTQDEKLLVVLNQSAQPRPIGKSTCIDVGSLSGFDSPMSIFEIQGMVEITYMEEDENTRYTIQTSSPDSHRELIWKGKRAEYPSSPFPVFCGLPKLYELNEEGEYVRLPERNIEWVYAQRGGAKIEQPKKHTGPLDAWFIDNGRRQRRFRMAVVGSDAKIALKSGENENEGVISLQGWYCTSVHTTQEELGMTKTVLSGSTSLQLTSAATKPPTHINIAIGWKTDWPLVQLILPFPSTGGRFSKSDGTVLPDKAQCSMKSLHDLRVHVFDQNPTRPKRYRLEIKMRSITQKVDNAQVNIPLNAHGFGEIRFFEIESLLFSLLSHSDSLDAKLELMLFVGDKSNKSLTLTRYDISLELEVGLKNILIPDRELKSFSIEQRNEIQLKAIPLLETVAQPVDVEQIYSEDTPTGCWSTSSLAVAQRLWLIYSGVNSSLQIRPMFWISETLNPEKEFTLLSASSYDLGTAMEVPLQPERDKAIEYAMHAMIVKWDKPCWKIVEHQYPLLRHLPLNTLDYWRIFSRNQEATLALVLRVTFSQPTDIPELMQRMQNELGIVWELTSKMQLIRAWDFLSNHLSALIGIDSSNPAVSGIMVDIFSRLGYFSESLSIQIDHVIFEKTGGRSPQFLQLVTEFNQEPRFIVNKLWSGGDALVQRILLRNHNDSSHWPSFKLAEKFLEIASKNNKIEIKNSMKFLNEISRRNDVVLLWNPDNIKTTDVTNAPLLAGFFIQFEAAASWFSGELISQLRQIRNFDQKWFDTALQTGNLLALKAKESNIKALHKRS